MPAGTGVFLSVVLTAMDFDGKVLALLLRDESDGNVEASCHTGVLRGSALGYKFHREDGSVSLDLKPEWLKRIKPVPDAAKRILLDADFVLSLSVGPIPDDMDPSELLHTGLRLPPED